AGPASRFAGSAATGTPPKTGTSTGATPSWAASVTANADTSGRGPGSAAARGWANSAMPAHAPAESRKLTDPTSSGSTSSTPVTASASRRRLDTGRPSVDATNAT